MAIHKAKKHMRRAEEAIRQAAYELGITSWLHITVGWDTKHADGDDGRIACTTVADWEYRQVGFVWNVPIVATLTDEDLHDTALHELVHALIAPLWDSVPEKKQENKQIAKLNELAVENVCRVIKHVLEAKDERSIQVAPA